MSSRSRTLFIGIVLLVTAASCAFEPGQPWGVAEFDVTASFDPPDSRLENGALKTSKDYRVELDTLEVEFDVVELEIASGGEVAAFDPANPPEGYSLCHGGHCHSDDGRLVPYDEIEAEVSGGDLVVTQSLESSPVSLGVDARTIALDMCTNDCELPPGALSLVRLRLHEVHVAGTVSDVRDRIDPTRFDETFELSVDLTRTVKGAVGKGEAGLVSVDVEYGAPAELFDGVDFETAISEDGEFAMPEAIAEALTETLNEHSLLEVSVEQTELP
jgi:hypothetical protein